MRAPSRLLYPVIPKFGQSVDTLLKPTAIDLVDNTPLSSNRYHEDKRRRTSSLKGEQHYWVHVAIDRFTGEVLDKQIEVVNE